MIGTIRRHQQWVWGVVIAAMCVSLLFWTGARNSGGGGGGFRDSSNPNLGSINGEPITREQLSDALKEARLFYYFQNGTWPDSPDLVKQTRAIAERGLVIQSLLKDYKIIATTDAAARFLNQTIFHVPAGQSMQMDRLKDWERNELYGKGGLTMDDMDRFARHQAGQESLVSLFGMSGKLITPKEAEFFYRRRNEPMATEMASFPTTNFYSATPPTEAELQDYFTKNEAVYRLPDRVQINYVAFEPTNYLTNADKLLGTNVDERVAEIYHQQGPDAFKDESNKPMLEPEAEAKIKKQMRLIAAYQEAKKAAGEFLGALSEGHDDAHPFATTDLGKLAKARNLVCKTTEPFDQKNGCKDLALPPKSTRILFSLRDYAPGDPDATNDPEKTMLYPSSPLIGESNIYVAGLQKQWPSQLQPLAAVRDQVVKDYRTTQALALAKEVAESFAGAVQVGLAEGKSFDAVCKVQNVKPVSLPPFTLESTNLPPGLDEATFRHLQEVAFTVPTEKSSRYTPTADGGFVVYVKARLPVDEARMKEELPVFLANMRQQRQAAAFYDWLNRQYRLRYVPPPSEGGAG
jgi:hypothetical protein